MVPVCGKRRYKRESVWPTISLEVALVTARLPATRKEQEDKKVARARGRDATFGPDSDEGTCSSVGPASGGTAIHIASSSDRGSSRGQSADRVQWLHLNPRQTFSCTSHQQQPPTTTRLVICTLLTCVQFLSVQPLSLDL